MRDAFGAEHLDRLANDPRAAHLARVGHKAKPSGPSSVDERGQRSHRDRLVADQAQSDHASGRECHVERQLVVR